LKSLLGRFVFCPSFPQRPVLSEEQAVKLTRSVSYAVGILLQISDAHKDVPVTAATIARGCEFPPRFLYRVLRRLVDAKILLGTSGPSGGYMIARSPRTISLLDIVSAVESHPEANVLVPARKKHRQPIELINKLCDASAVRFSRELAKVKLTTLQLEAAGGKRRSKKRA
jgi:Rrf2 family protein